MSKEIYISSTPHETRLAIVEDEALTEIYYERENEYTLAGSIYNGRVTRVLPGMQSSFVDIGLERDAFLYITDFMEEAPDSEEFDTTPAGDRAPRAINAEQTAKRALRVRIGGRSERGGRGRRGGRDRDRNSEHASVREAPTQRQHQQDGGRGDAAGTDADDTAPTRVQRRLPRSAKALPAPMEAAAGADAADAVAGAAHPARQAMRRARRATRRRRTPQRLPRGPGLLRSTGYGDDDSTFERESTHEIDGEASPAIHSPADRTGPRTQ